MLQIGRQLAHPFAQRILIDIEVAGSLGHRTASIPDNFTASSLNSRLNFLFCIPTLQFRQTPYLGCARNRQQATSRLHVGHIERGSENVTASQLNTLTVVPAVEVRDLVAPRVKAGSKTEGLTSRHKAKTR